MTDVPDQGLLLLELQKADTEIVRATRKLDEAPEKGAIIQTRQKRAEVQALREKADQLLSGLTRKLSAAEDEASTLDDKIDVEQAKLMSGDITNPKEIQFISREMDSLKRHKDKLEMQTLDLMERVEKTKGQIDKVDAALEQLDAREQDQVAAFKQVGGELQSVITQAERRRVTIIGALTDEMRARYEQVKSTKGAVAVGALEGSTCTGCRMELPSQRVADLKAGPEVSTCPVCHRIIIVRAAVENE